MSHKMIFVNLPITDQQRTRKFYTDLGYTFNENFCDGNALCLEVGPNIYAMLLAREFFDGFHDKETADPRQTCGVLLAVDAPSREAVDEQVSRAVAAGAREGRTEDHGFMYGRSFDDPDGHTWEITWMDPQAAQDGPPQS